MPRKKNTMMNIKMYAYPQNKTFQFEIAKGNKILLIGKDYADKAACVTGVENTLRAILMDDMITIASTPKGYSFHADKAESKSFRTLDDASDALAYLKEVGIHQEGKFEINFEAKHTEVVSKKKLGSSYEGYDFKQASLTNKAGFELLDKEKEQLFYFHLNDETGRPILYSRAYDGKRQRVKALNNLVQLIKTEKTKPKIIPLRNNFVFVLTDTENIEIARSKTFKSRAEAKTGIAYLEKTAQGKSKLFKLPKKKKKATKLPKEKFLLQQIAPKGTVGFEAFRNKENRCHYFHYHNTQGKALLFSPAFHSRKQRDESMLALIELSQIKDSYVMKEKDNQHYFQIVSEKGGLLARSKYFETKRAMILAMKHVLGKAKNYLNQNNVIHSVRTEKIPITVNLTADAKSNGKKPRPKAVLPKKNPSPPPLSQSPQKVITQPTKKTPHPSATNGKKSPPKTTKPITPTPAPTPNIKATKTPTVNNKQQPKSSPTRTKKQPTSTPTKKTNPTKPPTKKVAPPSLKKVSPTVRSTTKVATNPPILPSKKPRKSKKIAPPKTTFSAAALIKERNPNSWLVPLLTFVLGLLLGYFLFRSCSTTTKETPTRVEKTATPKNIMDEY